MNAADNSFRPQAASEAQIEAVWQAIVAQADSAGLDAAKFGADHREIVARIVDFLSAETPDPSPASNRLKALFSRPRAAQSPQPVRPIIICGVPGTGKTTFLYLLDRVLRAHFDLPDTLQPTMTKGRQRLSIIKRQFAGAPVSLLSVRKWADLLHFYAWDVGCHRLIREDLVAFMLQTLVPMRVLFADEVEMTGYAPTIPDLAEQGLLVVGSSNQYAFQQLDQRDMAPIIYRFEGQDLRAGEPREALVAAGDSAETWFDFLAEQPPRHWERLTFRHAISAENHFVLLDFLPAVDAPMLETEWQQFFAWVSDGAPTVLLLDGFSLETLRTRYNDVIRFVALFDVVEQLELGVLMRPLDDSAELSREALNHMQVTIYSARGVAEEIKQKTVVGLGRATSRIGQAGHRARQRLPTPPEQP